MKAKPIEDLLKYNKIIIFDKLNFYMIFELCLQPLQSHLV